MRTLRLRRQAKADLQDIWLYGAERWSVTQADLYLRRLERTFELLCAYPEIARLHDEFTPSARVYPVLSHVLIFLVEDDVLDLVRVAHARSDWQAMLGGPAIPDFDQ
jgi:toxin ParE1/3/4